VPEKAKRRQFSPEYKLRVLREADACRGEGEIGALLRREGLYSSHLTTGGGAGCRTTGGPGTEEAGPSCRSASSRQNWRNRSAGRAPRERLRQAGDHRRQKSWPRSWGARWGPEQRSGTDGDGGNAGRDVGVAQAGALGVVRQHYRHLAGPARWWVHCRSLAMFRARFLRRAGSGRNISAAIALLTGRRGRVCHPARRRRARLSLADHAAFWRRMPRSGSSATS
jgi:hypothetical protein